MSTVRTGLDRLSDPGFRPPGTGRIGLLCNATTVDARWRPTAEAIHALPGIRLERIFSPQHGFAAEKQDNMIESRHGSHPSLGIPIVSLYGERRTPTPDQLEGLDAILIDLPDVGTRVYTFLVTALLLLRAAHAQGIPVAVLDRPNPIGGAVEGPVLDDAFRSFVGIVDVPLRHGLTAGEYCLYGSFRLGLIDEAEAERSAAAARRDAPFTRWLSVVRAAGWSRADMFDATGLPWTPPSPNMPALETALVYPGQVALEGTNLSEGRGTTRPFELCGAPFLDPPVLRTALEASQERGETAIDGAILREVAFEPTFHKFAGETIRGFQIHVVDRARFRPVRCTTALLSAIRRLYPDRLVWRPPPYEYEQDRMPIDLIYGTDSVRHGLDSGADWREIEGTWQEGRRAYRERVRPHLLYEKS
ncbi:MAG: DUF1343 domain-containing protein [Candidatus Eisenbacteria bacterium]|nr:DUF1343 domain-containing protein [Candidatus Latescibacterota bacterium]MBD3302440.1 DUF1343 domain-containing protein [Candidatus Eisenbacteria bacterium]